MLTVEKDCLGKAFWLMNCPLQMWGDGGTSWRVINYMPRKETCCEFDERISADEMPAVCRNSAAVLRNLAALFDAMAEGKIDTIYYPGQTVEEAIQARQRELPPESRQ